jgi:hypothetical protein
MSNDMKIYLAGYINSEVIEECLGWRKRVRGFYDNWKGGPYPIDWIDPLNGENFAEITMDGLKSKLPTNTIVHKDYRSVAICDLIVANMNTFGRSRPPIGTICEIVWAWEMHKPIIMITEDPIYKFHPFLEYFTSWIIPTVDELLEKKVINEFYKAWHSAQY